MNESEQKCLEWNGGRVHPLSRKKKLGVSFDDIKYIFQVLRHRSLDLEARGLISFSQAKKSGWKFLAIQNRLANWIRNYQSRGHFQQMPWFRRERVLLQVAAVILQQVRLSHMQICWKKFKQKHNLIAAGTSVNVSHINRSGSTVQTPSSTELMLGSMVRVPTVLPFLLHPSPEVPSH